MILRIDGKQIEAKKWDTILSAAKRNGISIPSLCHHDALENVGACRLCVVEVKTSSNGERKLVTACEYKVAPHIEVFTHSEAVRRSRQTTLDLLLARAPENKLLLDLSRENGVESTSYSTSPDANECILCYLCTRACEKMGCNAISAVGRGQGKSIQPPFLTVPDACVGCGSCAAICPTGFIEMIDMPSKRVIWGKEFERAKCESCGAPLIPVAYREWAIANRELPEDYYLQCQECKRKELASKFSGLGVS
ncbi:MAG: (2Fe-2S)-binding protein [Deltaproteobacteria bacterium]|nr:(2Fe-2S)-binding protein [Deltaproteobacteria bacterium]MBN2671674.1 (2Fe-2S)-binding protein [Deltaproteobacteria bacterium]